MGGESFRIPAVVFVPRAAPQIKRRGIEELGAIVDAESADYDAAMVRAKAFASERGLTYIYPCLGDTLIAGQGTVALEILEELPRVAMVVTPVGGAGLLAGTGSLLRRKAPKVRIAGAQSVNTGAMSRSLAAGRSRTLRACRRSPTDSPGTSMSSRWISGGAHWTKWRWWTRPRSRGRSGSWREKNR